MNIAPDQARELLDGARPGPWYAHTDTDDPDGTFIYDEDGHMCIAVEPAGSDYREADLALAAAAPDLAQTIAGMTEQWRHEAWHDRGDGVGPWRSLGWPHDDGWRNTRESADFDLEQADGTFKHRLVCRLVGPVEATE